MGSVLPGDSPGWVWSGSRDSGPAGPLRCPGSGQLAPGAAREAPCLTVWGSA